MTTLGYALLGLLAERPLSGYDLAQQMKTPVGFFWHARHSQIYPELARLEADGMVTHAVVEQYDRPDKKLYTITEAGLATLKEWLVTPTAITPIRDELVLKAYNLGLADPQQAIALFRAEELRHREQLANYEVSMEWCMQTYSSEQFRFDSPGYGNYLTLRRGIGYEREYVEWCAWIVEQLEEYSKS